MLRVSVEMVRISHLRISDLDMVSRNVDSKINPLFNIRDKSERNYIINQFSLRLLLFTVSYCLYNKNSPETVNLRYKTSHLWTRQAECSDGDSKFSSIFLRFVCIE